MAEYYLVEVGGGGSSPLFPVGYTVVKVTATRVYQQ
jgi:hypothetical protein